MKYLDLIDASVPNWHEHAACRRPGNDPRWWHPTTAEEADNALAICNTSCPVRDKCLAWAFEMDDQHGILGGKTAIERRKMLEADDAA